MATTYEDYRPPEGTELHPETVAFLQSVRDIQPLHELTTEEARQRRTDSAKAACEAYTGYVGDRSELFVPSTQVPDGIPVFVYKPDPCLKNPAILIYFHGGGMVIGTRYSSDVTCKMLAQQAQCIVVNVEYRLVPEHPYPAMMQDARTVAEWTLQNKLRLGGSSDSVVGVGGDSAGGTISASVAHDVPGLGFQILVYPHVHPGRSLPSYKQCESGPLLSKKLLEWFTERHGGEGPKRLADPVYYASLRTDFSKLPPALFIVAEVDPLRDDSYEYAKKLQSEKVPYDLLLVKGAVHTFFLQPAHFQDCCRLAYDKTVEFIRKYSHQI